MPSRQEAEGLARCPAWLLANADRVFAHAAASVHTAYFSAGSKASNCWQNMRRPATSSLFWGPLVNLWLWALPEVFPISTALDPGGGMLWVSWQAQGGLRQDELVGWTAPPTLLPAGFWEEARCGYQGGFFLPFRIWCLLRFRQASL